MSHFYADIQGNRGGATRGGTKASGISGHIRGWRTGARVVVSFDPNTGRDNVTVYRTGGSMRGSPDQRVAHWEVD